MTRFICTAPFPLPHATQRVQQQIYTVVTPSKRASAAIKSKSQSLTQLAQKHLQTQKQASVSPIKAQAVLRQVIQETVIQETVQPADVAGTARAWMQSIKALLQSCSSVSAAASAGNLSVRAQRLLTVALRYQLTLRDQGLIEPSELCWRAAESSPAQKRLMVYGYFQPQREELAWINALAATGSVIFLPTADSPIFAKTQAAVDWLRAAGWEVMIAQETPSSTYLTAADSCSSDSYRAYGYSSDSYRAHGYSTFEAEVRGTLAQVKALRTAEVAEKEIAIIARDERGYGPKLLEIAWEYGLRLRVLYDTALSTTRLGAWIQLLLTVIEAQFPFESTARLLSHPLCSNPDSNFWAAARAAHPKGFAAWYEIVETHLSVDLVSLKPLKQGRRRRDTWVALLMDVLKAFSLRRRCARWPRESVAFNNLQQALVEVSRPERELLTWAEFQRQIEEVLAVVTVPAQPGRGGIELHSPASIAGARYAHLFVVGMAEGVLPPVISDDPILDFFERSHLNQQGIPLPSAADLFHKEALDFHFLRQAAERITFSYPKLKDRKEQLPSPYLAALDIAVSTPPELPISSSEELRRFLLPRQLTEIATDDSVLAAAVDAFKVESHRESADAADEYDGIIDQPFSYTDWTFSVSQLTNLGQCPFKWFADKVLALGDPAEADAELSPSLKGTLYHKVVELLVQALQESPPASRSKALTDLSFLRATFLKAESAIAFPPLPAWEQRRADHVRQLMTALNQPDFWPLEAQPVALEEKFIGEWAGLKVTGRVDRIDRMLDGLMLIDYKTSSQRPKGLKDSSGRASIDLQLQLYQETAAPALFPEDQVMAAKYFSLTKGKELKVPKNAPQHELPAAIERCKMALDKGHYPVQPDRKRDACRYCNFDLVCRQGSRTARKENAQKEREARR